MFEIGDYIVYGQNGICKIVDITHPQMAGIDNDRLYYVLIPQKTRDSKLFCPADNDKLAIRRVISPEEAGEILSEAKNIEPLVVTNDRMRDDSYKTVMKTGDIRGWVSIYKTLINRKKEREESGKKITATDERYLKLVDEAIYSELIMVTGKDKEELKVKLLA